MWRTDRLLLGLAGGPRKAVPYVLDRAESQFKKGNP